jgi:serine/threonine protein kinase
MRIPAELWPELSRLFDEALNLSPDERAPWLARLDGDRPPLAAHLRRLLAAHAQRPEGDVLHEPPMAFIASALEQGSASPPLEAGQMLGPYRLVSPIGQGGMASVWLAEQTLNVVRRVALKLPAWGLEDTAATAARFAQERDFLAGLEHAHIARLYDAGVSEDGQPYLAMEWIDGVPITRYADERRLGVRERIALFLQVLQAVRHAHARLIIHRDIKPSNILVTPEGEVKLLDFGIARLLADGPGVDAAGPSLSLSQALTPDTASPEQLAGEPLGTPSDVYSLGVVLYELLTGRRPYTLGLDSRTRTPAALHAALVDTVVPAPSSQAPDDASARLRNARPAQLRRMLAGDLDAIVGKALKKVAAERCQSAEALAADLERYLRFEPVQARRRSWRYVAARALRKHRTGAVATAIVAVAIAAGVGGVLWQAQLARDEARRATTIQDFLFSVFRASAPDQARGKDVNVKELMSRGTANLDRMLRDQPRALAEVHGELGDIYNEMGDNDDALKHLDRALAGFDALGLPRSRGAIDARFHRGVVMGELSRWPEARADFDRCLEWGAAAFGPRNRWAVAAREKIAFIELEQGRTDDAMRTAQLALTQPVGEDEAFDAWRRLRVRNVIGQIQIEVGQYAEARETFRRLLEDGARVPSFGVDDSMVARLQMARASHYEGDDAAALPVVQALVPDMERVLGPAHPHTLSARGLLSQALAGAGRYDDAIEVQQASLARQTAVDPAQQAIDRAILATHFKRAQRYAEALPLARQSLDFFEAQSAKPDSSTLFVRRLLGEIEVGAGRTREGTARLESVRDSGLALQGFQDLPDWPAVLGALAVARRLGGDLAAAAQLLDQACTLLAKPPGPPRLAALHCEAERAWLRALLAPQDAAAREAYAAAARAYAQRLAESHPARADLAMMQAELDGAAGRGSADDRRRASAAWQASMHRPWPGRLIELH